MDVRIDLDGTGKCIAESGIPFLDHMLDQIASHGLFDLTVRAKVGGGLGGVSCMAGCGQGLFLVRERGG